MDDFVCCPHCRRPLGGAQRSSSRLECDSCGRVFPVRNAVTDFVEAALLDDFASGQHDIYHGEDEDIPGYARPEEVRAHTDHVMRIARDHRMVLPTWLGLEVSRIVEGLGPEAGDLLLDVGCGVGTVLNSMSVIYGTRGVGVDFAGSALSACASYNPCGNLYFRGDALMLPFADDTFDLTFSFGVIEHVSNRRDMIEEMARVTRSAGTILVLTPKRDDRFTWHWWQRLTSGGRYRLGVEHLWGHDPENFLEPAELASLMETSGIVEVTTHAVHSMYSTILDEMTPGLISTLLERPAAFRAVAFALEVADEPLSARGHGNEFVATGRKGRGVAW